MIEIPISAKQSREVAEKIYQEDLKKNSEELFYKICEQINYDCNNGNFVSKIRINKEREIEAFQKITKKIFKDMGYKIKTASRYDVYGNIYYQIIIKW